MKRRSSNDFSLDFLRKKSSMLGRSGRYASRRFETETWQFSFALARMTEQVLFTNGRKFLEFDALMHFTMCRGSCGPQVLFPVPTGAARLLDQQTINLLFELGQIILDGTPNDFPIHVEVVMNHFVAHAAHLGPR